MNQPSKRMKVFLGSAVILIAAVAALPSKGAQGSTATNQEGFVPKPFRSNASATEIPQGDAMTLQRRRSEELSWGRNPFRDPRDYLDTTERVPQYVAKDLPKLSGISTIGDERMAIIGRQIVGVGDVLESGHLVTGVSETNVSLQREGKGYTLHLEMKP
ncbi:MAG: hypothetical protein ACPG31_00175 [Planctomycetota bacterium]